MDMHRTQYPVKMVMTFCTKSCITDAANIMIDPIGANMHGTKMWTREARLHYIKGINQLHTHNDQVNHC
jgi:hypothetical protein